MIEMRIAGVRSNIVAKLNAIRLSNPLYYHKHKTDYERLMKDFKKSGMNDKEGHLKALEELLEALDDTLRGDML